MSRAVRLLAVLTLALAASVGVPATHPIGVRGAEDDLIVVGSARYDVRPNENRVHVTVDLSATNTVADTAEYRTFFSGITLAVQPGATGLAASGEGSGLGVSIVDSTADYIAAQVTFSRSVFYNQTYRFQLTFDIVDNGGAPERDTRIRPSFVAFPVWAFGTHGGAASAVEVAVPGAYEVALLAGEMDERADEGGTIVSATGIADPSAFFAYLTAELPNAQQEERLDVVIGQETAEIALLGWPDDPEWTARMRDILSRGLPALGAAIGLDYPILGELTVRENAYSRLGNYAGYFVDQLDTIEVRFDVDPFVALHESAHIWFNASLFADRWIGEAFASYYAELAADRAGFEIRTFTLDDDLETFAFQLNAWGDPGTEELVREDYAYAATLAVGRAIAELATAEGLQAVWRAARDHEMAYQVPGADEPEDGESAIAGDWRHLLDLLEERTDADYDPIFVEWVVTPDEEPLLAEREAARTAYAETVERAGTWAMPRNIRLRLDAWQFDLVDEMLVEAEAALDRREAVAERAAELDLDSPDTMRTAFEEQGFEQASRNADAQLDALDAIDDARAALGVEPVPVEVIGLMGEPEPAADLAAAGAAYEDGSMRTATDAAEAAAAARGAAAGRGRDRVIIAGGGILALDAIYIGTLVVLRARRQRPDDVEQASLPPVDPPTPPSAAPVG